MAKITPSVRAHLEQSAREAAKAAYAPYSRFRVGAAALASSGRIYSGCNVENASYGLCMCAERSAVFAAIAAGETKLGAVAVYTSTPTPTNPCGACRQVISEFGGDVLVISICDSSRRSEKSVEELLPDAFGRKNLGRGKRR